jgi:pilus assembly protein Flp/PilA
MIEDALLTGVWRAVASLLRQVLRVLQHLRSNFRRPNLKTGERMMRTLLALRRVIENNEGVTAIEYGLIAALIAVAAVVVMGTVGTNLSGVFSQVASSLQPGCL